MLLSVILGVEFLDGDGAVLVEIQGSESLLYKVGSELVHFAYDGSEELVEVNLAAAVQVHRLEEVADVHLLDIDPIVLDGLRELVFVKRARVVVIEDLELSAQASDPPAPTLTQSLSEPRNQDSLELGNRSRCLHLQEGCLLRLILELCKRVFWLLFIDDQRLGK